MGHIGFNENNQCQPCKTAIVFSTFAEVVVVEYFRQSVFNILYIVSFTKARQMESGIQTAKTRRRRLSYRSIITFPEIPVWANRDERRLNSIHKSLRHMKSIKAEYPLERTSERHSDHADG